MNIKNTVANMLKQMNDFQNQIVDDLQNIPDNPKIKKISKHCFTISSKNLENNWSPEFYDSKHQVRTIIELINKKESLMTVTTMLEEIVNNGVYTVQQGHRMKFNNQVIEYIKNIL